SRNQCGAPGSSCSLRDSQAISALFSTPTLRRSIQEAESRPLFPKIFLHPLADVGDVVRNQISLTQVDIHCCLGGELPPEHHIGVIVGGAESVGREQPGSAGAT